jgi:uncharacterized protein YprB with RNaseH-like and TPR domain
MSEAHILESLDGAVDMALEGVKVNQVTWGGFNLRSFDLNWIYHRAVKYDLSNLMDYISRERFAKNVLDVRELWTGGDPYGKGKLKDIARFLGIETIPDVDGSMCFDLFLDKKFEQIAEYCKRDVEITREIAWRMDKGNAPAKKSRYQPTV